MRVIAGIRRGMPLKAPDGLQIRPTLDRVREALFSILGPDYTGLRFLDLFAGTGANGIEALSRGAKWATFVDSERIAVETIKSNLAYTRLSEGAVVMRLRLPDDLDRVTGVYDIVYIDPPYDFAAYDRLLGRLGEHGLLSPGARVVIEHEAKTPVPDEAGGLARCDTRAYGQTHLSFYQATLAGKNSAIKSS